MADDRLTQEWIVKAMSYEETEKGLSAAIRIQSLIKSLLRPKLQEIRQPTADE